MFRNELWFEVNSDWVFFFIFNSFVDEVVVNVVKIVFNFENWRKIIVLRCFVCGCRVREIEIDLIGIFFDDENI